MQKILVPLASIIVAMITEILLRRLDKAVDADAAEAEAIKAAVALGMAAASAVEVPLYFVPLKFMLMNESTLTQLAKFAFDGAEAQIRELLKALDAEKLAALQADLA